MKGAFGLIGLVAALLIVGALAKKQLHAAQSVAPAVQGTPAAATVREQSVQVQQKVQQDVQRALDLNAQRASDAAQ
jgi:hypothetical protein